MISEEVSRRETLDEIRDAGIDPYPATSARTHLTKEVLADFEALETSKETVCVAGRIKALRKHGGLTFLRLQDRSGVIQIAVHKDAIGEEMYNQLHKQADVGDFYEFSGTAFKTRREEPSIDTATFKLLTKTLLPLPEKFHGLTDTEKRYRQRYLDLVANEESMKIARTRSMIVRSLREFLAEEGFLEVETPVLQPIAGGANANPFLTHHNTLHHDFFLRIAPELYLKRLMVGGMEKVYEFARCFRNEGISPQHNPEFTQIELYWAYATIEDLMDHLERMLAKVVTKLVGSTTLAVNETEYSFAAPIPRITFRQAVLDKTGIDLDEYTDEEALRTKLVETGLKAEGVIGLGELYDYLYKESVRPHIVQPTFVTDYPASMKPLAKRRAKNPAYSASAQLVMNGVEMWNAFNELNDPIEQEERFMEQESLRERGSEDAQRVDHDYLTALKHGMPPTAGYGLGIDRLVMLLTGSTNLKEVILFPTLKPLPDTTDQTDDDEEES